MKKLLFIIWLSSSVFAQEKTPKIGLVLSGGGAKGFAHVGVLKEIEKAGIQIDYIGGTSMGAIIGGLYASGYNATQIEDIIKKIDFYTLLQDEIPRRDKPYFQKTNLENHAVSLPFKKGKLELPLGLSKGQNVLNLFTELLAHVDEINDFKKLPIPFFCIATDVETGDEIIIEKGALPLAIRASGSFPSLLHPVEIDERFLIDGGVANNFPVDIIKSKGVDIIIGVDVQAEQLMQKKDLSSITSVLSQIISFEMHKKNKKLKKSADVYIHPKLPNYSVISFDNSKDIIEKGEIEAKRFSRVFDSISSKQNKTKRLKKIPLSNNKKFLIDRIILKGNKNYTRKYVLGKLQLKEGDSASYVDISKKINTLSATKVFERVDYHFLKSFSGKKLEINLKESEVLTYINVGAHYDELYQSGVLLNFNRKKTILKNDELSANIIIGDNIRYNLDYFLDKGTIGFGIQSRLNSFSKDFLFDTGLLVNKINLDYTDFTNRLYIQTTLDKKFAFGFGAEHKKVKATTETILVNEKRAIFDNSNYINGFSYLRLDTFDKPQFPTNGFLLDANFVWYLWSDRNDIGENTLFTDSFFQYSQIFGTLSFANTFWKNFTFQLTSSAGYTLGEEETNVFDFRLGGYNKNYINNFYHLYGYNIGELTEQSFLKTEFDLRFQFYKNNYLSLIANYARVESNVFKDLKLLENIKSGYAVGYGLETVVGPIELKYTWSPEKKEGDWLFNFGFWF